MSKSTLPRLKALRDEMGKAGITAFIIPGTDPHQSEYYASHWAARTWKHPGRSGLPPARWWKKDNSI